MGDVHYLFPANKRKRGSAWPPDNRFLVAFKQTTGESTFSRLATRHDEVAKTRPSRPDLTDLLAPGRSQ
jgi:hypothetical protein